MQKNKAIVEQDLVLIYMDEKPAFYARVEQVTADRKSKWWQVKLLFLTLPPHITTWIIDDDQLRGADFTMGGTPIRIEKLVIPESGDDTAAAPEQGSAGAKKARVLSMKRDKDA